MCGLHAHHTGGRRESTAGRFLGSRVAVGVAEPESEHRVAVAEQPGAHQRSAHDGARRAEDHDADHPLRTGR